MKAWRIFLILWIVLNGIYTVKTAIRTVKHNIAYLQGDKYAGYPPHARAMFIEMDSAYIPLNADIYSRKPEFLYLRRGVQSRYPWEVE